MAKLTRLEIRAYIQEDGSYVAIGNVDVRGLKGKTARAAEPSLKAAVKQVLKELVD